MRVSSLSAFTSRSRVAHVPAGGTVATVPVAGSDNPSKSMTQNSQRSP